MNKLKHMSLNANFNSIEDYNSSFLRTKLKVFAFGKNRNGSYITEAAFDKARNSISNIPVVAKFSDFEDKYGNDGDLEGHNSYLTVDKEGNLTIKQDTFPIGVVSSDANISFEDVNEGTEENPDIKTYVVVDNVFLWKRYDAVNKIQEWINNEIEPKISMEIGNISGEFSKENKSYMINSFEFEAIAALGSEIEPCFPMAQIEAYSHQTFEESFYQMIKELKFSLEKSSSIEVDNKDVLQEGGNKLIEQVNEMLAKYSLSIDDLNAKEINYENFSTVEELEIKIKEVFASEKLDEEEKLVVEQFEEKEQLLFTQEQYDFALKEVEQNLQSQFETEKATIQSQLEDVQLKYAELQEKYSTMESKANELETKLNTIAQEEREEAETILFEQFSEKLTEDEMVEIKARKAEMSLEDIEKELMIVFAKKNLKFSLSTKEHSKPLRVEIPSSNKVSEKPYADMIEQRRSK